MADHKRKKKRGRSKMFRSCFRSFAADERPFSDGSNTRNGRLGRTVLIAVSGRQGKDFKIPDVNLVNGSVAVTDPDVDPYDKRPSPRRRMSRLLKAVLFDSLMVKKIRRSSSKSSNASDTSMLSLSSEKINKSSDDSNLCDREYIDMDDSSSRRSNLLSSSSRTTCSSCSTSSSSSANSNSRWSSNQSTSSRLDVVHFRHPISSNSSTLQKPDLINSSVRSDSHHLRRQDSSISLPLAKTKPVGSVSQPLLGLSRHISLDSRNLVSSDSISVAKPNSDMINNNWDIRWCLFLLLSFAVLVIYGRIYSILCTSTWFYFVPCKRQMKRVNSVTNAARFVDTDSEQYKKRVIMAGLLDRTRNPLR